MTLEEISLELQQLKEAFRRHKHDNIETEKLYLSGTVAPGFTPKFIGLTYCDTSAGKVYISTGTSSSTDWRLLN